MNTPPKTYDPSIRCNPADLCNRFGQIFYWLKAELAKTPELTHEPLTDDRISNDDRSLQ